MKTENQENHYARSLTIYPKENHWSNVSVYQRADIWKAGYALLPAEVSWYGSSTTDTATAEAFTDAMILAIATAKAWNKDAGKPAAEVLKDK